MVRQAHRKRVRRLLQGMGLEAIYRHPNTSKPAPGHKLYPYLLRGLSINRVNQVRDTYDLGGGLLLMVATDRISAFDVVLPNGVPGKGVVLSRMSAFWFRKTAHLVPNHLLGMAEDVAGSYPQLAKVPREVAQRAMVVKRAQRIDVECVVRGYLAGSAWAEYRVTGTIFGKPAPAGLKEGDRLSPPIFTPTTKAETGHDLNMTLEQVEALVGKQRAREVEEKSLAIYNFAHAYALERGIIIADTKVEFGVVDGKVILNAMLKHRTAWEPNHAYTS